MLMVAFNLQAAQRGEPVCTREGVLVSFIGYAPQCEPLKRVIAHVQGESLCTFFSEQGRVCETKESNRDLFMVARVRENKFDFLPQTVSVQRLIDLCSSEILPLLTGDTEKELAEALKPFESAVTLTMWGVKDIHDAYYSERFGRAPTSDEKLEALGIMQERYELSDYDWIALESAVAEAIGETLES
jgi:hypothetical protein